MREYRQYIAFSGENAMCLDVKVMLMKEGFKFIYRKSVIVSRKFSYFDAKIIFLIAIGLIPFLLEEIPIRHIDASMWQEVCLDVIEGGMAF